MRMLFRHVVVRGREPVAQVVIGGKVPVMELVIVRQIFHDQPLLKILPCRDWAGEFRMYTEIP